MSWAYINTILIFQIIVLYFLANQARNLFIFTSDIRRWLIPLADELLDIKEEMTKLCDRATATTRPMLKNIKFIAVTSTLAVVANMYGHDVVFIPFWASVFFTLESCYDIYKINAQGLYVDQQLGRAEMEIENRIAFAHILDKIEEAEELHNKEESENNS